MRNIKEVIINGVSLEVILKKHKKWLNDEIGREKADLSRVNLRGVDLRDANLRGVDLRGADLTDANLRGADLTGANLRGANLNNANLKYTNLKDIRYNENTSFFALQCPEEGSFIGYKKASNKIVKLLITKDSKRNSATSRKCRCSKAKVLSISNMENTEKYNEVHSNYDYNFIYKVGEIVEVDNFDKDRWNECSPGIHFFMTRDEAVRY